MRSETFRRFVQAHFAQCDSMGAVKGNNYANDDNDRLNNFRRDGKALGIAPEANLLTHAGKHWAAVNYYVRLGCPAESAEIPEPIVGRIYDLINYMFLLLALLEERHNGSKFEAALEELDRAKKEGTPEN